MQSEERLNVLKKIEEYEKEQLWDKDVENDPASKILYPKDINYLPKSLYSKILTKIANKSAINFFENEIKKGNLIIKDIKGIDNFNSVKGGAIITCNHFSIYDNYIVFRSIRKSLKKGHNLYKIIKEGNYTSFKGIFGFFFRHCNTLPLSSNMETMKKLLNAVSTLLSNGEKILIYPEQAMWWNYSKPRPFKSGAFNFAVKNNVPVIPCFITMEDTEKIGDDGFNIKAHTVHFLKPIYPKKDLTCKENIEFMKNENFNAFKSKYEEVYKIPLSYEVK